MDRGEGQFCEAYFEDDWEMLEKIVSKAPKARSHKGSP